MANLFSAMINGIQSEKDFQQVTEFPKDSNNNDVKPTFRAMGKTNVEQGNCFRFNNVTLGGNLYINTSISGKNPSYFTIVELLDPVTQQPTGEGRYFYFSSLCKTVYGYTKDSEGNPISVPGSYICTGGEVAKDAQNNKDVLSFIQSLVTRAIFVNNIRTLQTYNKFAKEDESKFALGYVFDFDYTKK